MANTISMASNKRKAFTANINIIYFYCKALGSSVEIFNMCISN